MYVLWIFVAFISMESFIPYRLTVCLSFANISGYHSDKIVNVCTGEQQEYRHRHSVPYLSKVSVDRLFQNQNLSSISMLSITLHSIQNLFPRSLLLFNSRPLHTYCTIPTGNTPQFLSCLNLLWRIESTPVFLHHTILVRYRPVNIKSAITLLILHTYLVNTIQYSAVVLTSFISIVLAPYSSLFANCEFRPHCL